LLRHTQPLPQSNDVPSSQLRWTAWQHGRPQTQLAAREKDAFIKTGFEPVESRFFLIRTHSTSPFLVRRTVRSVRPTKRHARRAVPTTLESTVDLDANLMSFPPKGPLRSEQGMEASRRRCALPLPILR